MQDYLVCIVGSCAGTIHLSTMTFYFFRANKWWDPKETQFTGPFDQALVRIPRFLCLLSLVSSLACLLWYGDACGRVLRQQLLFYERFNPQQEPAAAPKSAPKSQRDERFWYRTHTLVHDIRLVFFFWLYVLLSFTATLIGVWILLGMFLEPQRVAPFGNNLTM